MAAPESTLFPLVEIQAVANAQNEWVALSMRPRPAGGGLTAALHAMFGTPDLLAAIAPLDCNLLLDAAATLTDSLLAQLPPNRVILTLPSAALAAEGAGKRMAQLHAQGYRIFLDGALPDGVPVPLVLRSVSLDCGDGAPKGRALPSQFGPHLARRVGSEVRLAECQAAGFSWFSGDYPLRPSPHTEHNDGTSRKRLLALLGLVARDAETRELETLLKQDPALSYHLLKLVNSAAFAHATQITSFGQAIGVLGRRQLQRWLQLLLYAREDQDDALNLLLPLAALRAAQMEAVCKLQGGDRAAQDQAFMVGVFALLDVLFAMPMQDIVGELSLPPEVARALLKREGQFGQLLGLCEAPLASLALLQELLIDPGQWWQSQLQAYHWAIQVARNT
jgi:EAL and modified HD-GYP domain-containing signal transduction protein